jgi:hypothetical protein
MAIARMIVRSGLLTVALMSAGRYSESHLPLTRLASQSDDKPERVRSQRVRSRSGPRSRRDSPAAAILQVSCSLMAPYLGWALPRPLSLSAGTRWNRRMPAIRSGKMSFAQLQKSTEREGRHVGGPLSWGLRLGSKCNNVEAARVSFDKNQKPRDEARRIAANIAKLPQLFAQAPLRSSGLLTQ